MPEVKRQAAVAVLMALGHKDALGWDALKVQRKLNGAGGVAALCPRGHQIKSAASRRLFEAWCEAQRRGEGITICETKEDWDGRKWPEPLGPRGRPVGSPQRHVKPEYFRACGLPVRGAPSWVWAAYWRANPRPVPGKDESAVGRVVHELREAGRRGVPVTKEDLVAAVVAWAPSAEAVKTRHYIDALVPSKILMYFGIHVWRKRVTRGQPFAYWIEGTGRKKQKFPPTDAKTSAKWAYQREREYRDGVVVGGRKRGRKKKTAPAAG